MKTLLIYLAHISCFLILMSFASSDLQAQGLRADVDLDRLVRIDPSRLDTPAGFQKKLCEEYANRSMQQVATKNNRGCDLGTDRWKTKAEYFSQCMNPSNPFTKEMALAELEVRDYLLDYNCFSKSGDLAAHDWCYELDTLFLKHQDGKSWIESNIDFYSIVKNVGKNEWKSVNSGDGRFGVSYGSLQTETWGVSLSPYYWKEPGDLWKVGHVSYGFSTKEGYAGYRVEGLVFIHSEDTNDANNRKQQMTGVVSPIDFLSLSDAKSFSALGQIVKKDGAVVNHRCSKMNLTP